MRVHVIEEEPALAVVLSEEQFDAASRRSRTSSI